MDFLASNVVRLKFAGLTVSVPHPVNFSLLKLMVSERRQVSVKKENDRRQAVEVMKALIEAGDIKLLKLAFSSCPAKWQKTILKSLQNEPLTEELASLLK